MTITRQTKISVVNFNFSNNFKENLGVPHPDFGEVGIAICVPNNFVIDKEILATNVLREAKQKLSNYKVPKKVIIAENLPRNSMGKVQKKELREEYKNLFQSNQVVA